VADSARILELRRRVMQDPASLAFAPLAEEYRRAGRLDDAIKTCRAGLGLHPGYLSARATLGRALLDRGDLDDAFGELSTVLETAPEHLGALRGVADVLHRRGDLGAALQKYRMALALVRQDPELSARIAEIEQAVAASPPAHVTPTPAASAGAQAHGPDPEPATAAHPEAQFDGPGGGAADVMVLSRLEQFLTRILDDRARRSGV
jgi:tetratricopeptide (TPR) repeat protein